MTNPIGGSSSSSGSTDPNAALAGQPTISKDDFLQMLVAQLKNQDPMNPMDDTQFAAELAQFSEVEQLTNLNTTATAQASATAQQTLTQQVSFGNSLIGRDVVTSGTNLTVAGDGSPSRISVDITGAAGNVHVDILGADGKTVVGSQDFGAEPNGTSTLTVDTGSLPAGTYTYSVTANDANGKALPVTGFTVGTVQGTGFQNGAVVLTVNGVAVPISDIVEIIPSAAATATAATTPTTK